MYYRGYCVCVCRQRRWKTRRRFWWSKSSKTCIRRLWIAWIRIRSWTSCSRRKYSASMTIVSSVSFRIPENVVESCCRCFTARRIRTRSKVFVGRYATSTRGSFTKSTRNYHHQSYPTVGVCYDIMVIGVASYVGHWVTCPSRLNKNLFVSVQFDLYKVWQRLYVDNCCLLYKPSNFCMCPSWHQILATPLIVVMVPHAKVNDNTGTWRSDKNHRLFSIHRISTQPVSTFCASDRSLYSVNAVILSRWRERKMGVAWQVFRRFINSTCKRVLDLYRGRVIWDSGRC